MTARWSFVGYPMTDEQADRWPPRIPIRDERDGTYVERARTAEQVPVPRCACTHPERAHGTDRRGRPICHGSSMCACAAYRPLEKSA